MGRPAPLAQAPVLFRNSRLSAGTTKVISSPLPGMPSGSMVWSTPNTMAMAAARLPASVVWLAMEPCVP